MGGWCGFADNATHAMLAMNNKPITLADLGFFRIEGMHIVGGENHSDPCDMRFEDEAYFVTFMKTLPEALAKLESLTKEELAKENEVVWSAFLFNDDGDWGHGDDFVLDIEVTQGEGKLLLKCKNDDNEVEQWVRFVPGDDKKVNRFFQHALTHWLELTGEEPWRRPHWECFECGDICPCCRR